MIGHHEHMISDIAVGDAGRRGLGVFALWAFHEGEFIFRRRHGRVAPSADLWMLSDDERRHLCELGPKRASEGFPIETEVVTRASFFFPLAAISITLATPMQCEVVFESSHGETFIEGMRSRSTIS